MRIKEFLESAIKANDENKPSEFKYRDSYEFMLEKGQYFENIPDEPNKGIMGNKGECYRNCTLLALSQHSKYRYCEGYAKTEFGFVVQHAWLLDDKDVVQEITWDSTGVEYYGVIIHPKKLLEIVIESAGHVSMISNYAIGFPDLKGELDGWLMSLPKKDK